MCKIEGEELEQCTEAVMKLNICISQPLFYFFTENPPSAKQPTKMLVIKKVSKEDPAAAFSAAFTSPVSHLANGNKATTIVPSVYKNLVPKPAAPPSKVTGFSSQMSELQIKGELHPLAWNGIKPLTGSRSWNPVVSGVVTFTVETCLLPKLLLFPMKMPFCLVGTES